MPVILDNESEEGDAPAPIDMVDEQLECEDIEFLDPLSSLPLTTEVQLTLDCPAGCCPALLKNSPCLGQGHLQIQESTVYTSFKGLT
ncbi:hypothetical protein AVEN_87960-1 [Araneus ventricosus]|uniref:Uncharacterized protein n=1 Tax=Araneus ventricosus TaxID=182803 RepID=A0A4Y2I4M8_ARAVE|nr:hypothetical protein AVEN_87960-1 [Araneus ventricosus]